MIIVPLYLQTSQSEGYSHRCRAFDRICHSWHSQSMYLTCDVLKSVSLVCVCVSHPGSKGFPCSYLLFHRSRGMERTCEAPSNEAPHMILGYRQGRLPTYLQSTVAHAVPLSVCFMVVSHDTFPTNRFSHCSFQPLVYCSQQSE